jgi:hypothetical protein
MEEHISDFYEAGDMVKAAAGTSPEDHWTWINALLDALHADGNRIVFGIHTARYLYVSSGHHFLKHGKEIGRRVD